MEISGADSFQDIVHPGADPEVTINEPIRYPSLAGV
jgi:hypothetical protein